MIKVRTEKGKWKDETWEKDLYKEDCPNSNCEVGTLAYPTYLKDPFCPDCKTTLPGQEAGIHDGYGKRIAYHLEK